MFSWGSALIIVVLVIVIVIIVAAVTVNGLQVMFEGPVGDTLALTPPLSPANRK